MHDVWVRAEPLQPLDSTAPALSGSGFAPDAVDLSTQPPPVTGALKLYGSHLGSDASTGAAVTPWYAAVPHFSILITGFPAHRGNQVLVEVQTQDAGTLRLPLSRFENPADVWRAEEVCLPQSAGPIRFRIVAADHATDFLGWFGFSEPYLPHPRTSELLKQLALVVLAAITAVVVFLAPGMIVRQIIFSRSGRLFGFIWIPVPGILGAALLGLLAWKGPSQIAPASISRVGLWLLVLYACYHFFRFPLSRITSAQERRVLATLLILAAICVAKATYSVGPSGELYAGKVSRTLEVGDRSDSRVPYHVVQIVASRARAFGPLATLLLAPFNFSHRGPIASLAVAPVVLASPVKVPAGKPDQPWTIFDAEGFSGYRICMIVLACSSLATVFGIATLFLSGEWAFLAFLVTVTAPFVVHEIYFTWPKLEAAAFILIAAYLVFRSRYFGAGLSAGIGYLFHPSALLWVPALIAILMLHPEPAAVPAKAIYSRLRGLASLCCGLAVWLLLWRFVNREHFEQAGFLTYFEQAGPSGWLRWRLDSVANTLVPLNLFAFHGASRSINAVSGPSPDIVRFFFQYWNALPFGVGIAFFFCLLRPLGSAWKNARRWLVWVFAVPFALFAVYWGVANTGLMREGLHAWVLGLLISAVIVWQRYLNRAHRFAAVCRWVLLLRGAEVLTMLLLPAIASRHQLTQGPFLLSDVLSLSVMAVGVAWLSWRTFASAGRIVAS